MKSTCYLNRYWLSDDYLSQCATNFSASSTSQELFLSWSSFLFSIHFSHSQLLIKDCFLNNNIVQDESYKCAACVLRDMYQYVFFSLLDCYSQLYMETTGAPIMPYNLLYIVFKVMILIDFDGSSRLLHSLHVTITMRKSFTCVYWVYYINH